MIKNDGSHSTKILADIGTDHAKLPIYLLATSSVSKAYASDLREGPLKKARLNIEFYLGEKADLIETILCDGAEKIPFDANCVSIAGMGGELISKILDRAKFAPDTVFFLSPMKKPEKLRKYLYENGYEISEENLSEEDDKIYTAIKAVKTEKQDSFSEFDTYFSRALIRSKNPYLSDYVSRKIFKTEKKLRGRKNTEGRYGDIKNLENLLSEMYKFKETL